MIVSTISAEKSSMGSSMQGNRNMRKYSNLKHRTYQNNNKLAQQHARLHANMIASSTLGITSTNDNNNHHHHHQHQHHHHHQQQHSGSIDSDQQSLQSVFHQRRLLNLNESTYEMNDIDKNSIKNINNKIDYLQVVEEPASLAKRLTRKISSSLLNAMKKFQTPTENDAYNEEYRQNDYDDNVSAIQRYRPKPIDDLVKETRFTKKEIQLLYRGFKQECPSGIVNEQSFKEVYAQFFPHGDCADYAHYVFTTIDQNCDGIVNFEDFLLGLSILARGSIDEKLKWIFNLYDINRDGKITKDELEQIITSVYDLMGKFTDPPINDTTCKIHVDYVFKKITSDEITEITLDEFLRGCYKDPAIINSISMLDTMF